MSLMFNVLVDRYTQKYTNIHTVELHRKEIYLGGGEFSKPRSMQSDTRLIKLIGNQLVPKMTTWKM